MSNVRELDNQIDELDRQFRTLLDALAGDNRREVGQKLKEIHQARMNLSDQRKQVVEHTLATYRMSEQQRSEIIAALIQRFPKLNAVKLEPEAIGRALATIDWHTSKIAGNMALYGWTPAEAIAQIDKADAWGDPKLTATTPSSLDQSTKRPV